MCMGQMGISTERKKLRPCVNNTDLKKPQAVGRACFFAHADVGLPRGHKLRAHPTFCLLFQTLRVVFCVSSNKHRGRRGTEAQRKTNKKLCASASPWPLR